MSNSTGEPSGTRRTSIPRSAGAGASRETRRSDPGRRPSSRVSSTSGALGSRRTGPLSSSADRSRSPSRQDGRRIDTGTVVQPTCPAPGRSKRAVVVPVVVAVVAGQRGQLALPGQPPATSPYGVEDLLQRHLEVRELGVDVVVGLLAQRLGLTAGELYLGSAAEGLGERVDPRQQLGTVHHGRPRER